ncbi:MAG: hypothetical protein HC890_13330 [Chloroflexaceae bacterium]|nr:hypothetical protein [Chloroflexaceae bacterium]
MTKSDEPGSNGQMLSQWRKMIEIAEHNHIFYHCQDCQAEWVASPGVTACSNCGSPRLERISCWQFPDD